ncbi:hypothetical protein [Deinococcus sp.]|uniref:hypothetical protein n=1 Tax=Deinococcus sp. TaxID=47478 RepID=UPI0025C1FEE6|nr:hypothetical protein [Deinococcus sp.]
MKPNPLFPLLTSLTLAWLPSQAQAMSFGGLTVTPRGAQNLNLETGATDLPSGGTATDTRGGMVLSGAKMQLKPDDSLVAQNATLKTKQGGVLKANNVVYDLKSGTASASGNVSYSDARVKELTAETIVLYVRSGFVVASGGVKASQPDMSGNTLIFDPFTMRSVLTGPFSVNTRYGHPKGALGTKIMLTFGGSSLISANTNPSPDDLARFAPYLK